MVYSENFDSLSPGTLPPGWLKSDDPLNYNYIKVTTPAGPFVTNSLVLIDNQGGLEVIGQKIPDTQFTNGVIDLDFYATEPGLDGYDGQFLFRLYDLNGYQLIDIVFIQERGMGWCAGINGAPWSDFLPFDSTHAPHLTLYLNTGEAKLYMNKRPISFFTYTPTAVIAFRFISTAASIGALYIDNLVIRGK